MKNIVYLVILVVYAGIVFSTNSCCGKKGLCSLRGMGGRSTCSYDRICKNAEEKDGIDEITYEQFQKIRQSGEAYILLDVLPAEKFTKGHIPGARSFPLMTITAESAKNMLHKDDRIVVYCASFSCQASTKAAKKLADLGYTVVDYKGGLKEWKEKGNSLE